MPWKGSSDGDSFPFPSLGWLVLDWCADYLPSPRDSESPLVFTDEQARGLVEWYALDPKTCRYIYRRGCSRRSKGWGKSPREAAKAIAALAGPIVPDGWDAYGEPVGRPLGTRAGDPNPWVQIAAVSEDQTDNTYSVVYELLTANDGRAADELRVDAGLTRCFLMDRPGRLEPVTAAAGSREGQPVTEGVLDEAVHLDTVIPTPAGWATVNDLKVGDFVLSPDGEPCRVTKVTGVVTDRPCYKVTFTDRTSIVADAGHLWKARPSARAKPQVLTTEALASSGNRNPWFVPLTHPVHLPHADVPIDPYILGLWLGDGSTHQPHIAASAEDATWLAAEISDRGEHVSRIETCRTAQRIILGRDMSVCMYGHPGPFEVFPRGAGYRPGRRCLSCMSGVPRVRDKVKPFRVRLAELGVLKRKHVPPVYLRASMRQRLELLRGLMDSDGHVGETGLCAFVNTNECLANAVIELVRSLGMIAKHIVREDNRCESYKPVHKVHFMSRHGLVPVTLPRKAKRIRQCHDQNWKSITSIEPVESVPVKCIAVDSPDHLFLAGDGWTTTHNTHLWLPRNGGVRLARTIRRNLAKMNGRSYETTNSFVPGENSVAEKTHKAAMDGAPGIYYDAVEAPEVKEDDPDEKLLAALDVAYGDSWWVDRKRILADIRDPDMPWEDACRFNFNWNKDDRLKAVETKRWDALARHGVVVPSGSRIGLGFDGSISDDCTALIGCVVLDGVPFTFEIEVWSRPENAPRGWRIPRREVHARVRETFDVFDAGLMLCDPAKYQTEIEGWAEEFGEDRVVFFDTNVTSRMAKACDRWLTAVAGDGTYSHDGSATLTAHVLAMYKRKVRLRDDDDDGRTKFVFVKGPDKLKIDAGIGSVLALEAAMTMPAAPSSSFFAAAFR